MASPGIMELYADVDAITIKTAINILKETLTDVLFFFHEDMLEICGSDPENVSISKVVIQLSNVQLQGPNNSITIGVCLQDAHKFLRGADKKDGLVMTLEHGKLAFRLISSGKDRNSWYKFPSVHLAHDRMCYTPPTTTSQEVHFSSRVIQKSLKEIVHGHELVEIESIPGKGVTFLTYDPNLGGGRVTLFTDNVVLQQTKATYFVRYIQKLLRVLPSMTVAMIFPVTPQDPLVISYSLYEDGCRGWMALCAQTEG